MNWVLWKQQTCEESHLRERTRWKAHVRRIIYYFLVLGEDAFYLWKLIYAPIKISFVFSGTTKSYSFVCSSSQSTNDFDVVDTTYQMEHNAPNIIITQNKQILPSRCGLQETTKQRVIKYSAYVLTSLCQELSTLLECTQSVKLVCFP